MVNQIAAEGTGETDDAGQENQVGEVGDEREGLAR